MAIKIKVRPPKSAGTIASKYAPNSKGSESKNTAEMKRPKANKLFLGKMGFLSLFICILMYLHMKEHISPNMGNIIHGLRLLYLSLQPPAKSSTISGKIEAVRKIED